MKKIFISVLVALVIIIVICLIANQPKDVDKVLSQFETHESDGYYDNKNNTQSNGYIVSNKTEDGYKYGYVNYKGKILLKAEYNRVYRVISVENKDKVYLIAEKDGRYGVTLNGKQIIKYEYQFIDYYSKIGVFLLQKSDNYGVANIKGKIIIPVENESIEVKGNHIYLSNNGVGKVYDKNGKEEQIDFNTSYNGTSNEKYLIQVKEENGNYLYGITDNNEKQLVETKYTYIEYLFDDYFAACNHEEKEGVIDQNNNIKLEFKYNLVQKIQGTNLIRTLNNETNETEIYSQNFEKICTMKNANIEKEENTIKIFNKTETKYFDENGKEINK